MSVLYVFTYSNALVLIKEMLIVSIIYVAHFNKYM